MRPRLLQRLAEMFLRVAAFFSAAAILGVLAFLIYFSLPLFQGGGLAEIFTWDWRPHQEEFGILPMVAGSVCLSLLALATAFPVALGLCFFAHGVGPPRLGRFLLALVSFMTSIPTIVYAFVSAILLVPFIQELSGGLTSGKCLLAATLILSLLILPTIVLLVDAWWRSLGPSIRLTAATLGLTKAQELLWIVLPLSSRGLAVAAVMGFGRAIGDTMIALLLAGNAPQVPGSPLDSIRTLTAHIALLSDVDTQSLLYHSIFACGLILLAVTAILNVSVRWLRSLARRSAGHAAHSH